MEQCRLKNHKEKIGIAIIFNKCHILL
jgi:hypothetical protein